MRSFARRAVIGTMPGRGPYPGEGGLEAPTGKDFDMKATFIACFDCEGKWGLADCLSDRDRVLLTDERLRGVYQRLIDLLDRWEIRGTFAFVSAFTLSVEEFITRQEWFEDVVVDRKNWFLDFKKDVAGGRFQGWLTPAAFEIVRKASAHEIASHGFSHLPLSEGLISERTFLREMELVGKVAKLKDYEVKTLVYPRNLVGYLSALRFFGVIGYRGSLYSSMGKITGARVLLSDLNVFQKAQIPEKPNAGLVRIPPGFFLNPSVGLWRSIPVGIVLRRWFHAIDDALIQNGVIQLNTHPENFIEGGERQFHLFEQILKYVSERQKERAMNNLTHSEYCEQMLSDSMVAAFAESPMPPL